MAGNTDDVVLNVKVNPEAEQGVGGAARQGPGGQSASGEAVAPPVNPQPPGPGGASTPQPQQVGGGAGATGSPIPGAVGGGSSGTGSGPQGPGPRPSQVGGAHPAADFFADLGRASGKASPSSAPLDPFMPKQAPAPTWLDFQTDFDGAARAQEEWHRAGGRRKEYRRTRQEYEWEETLQQKYGTPEPWDMDPLLAAEFENIAGLQAGGKATAALHAGKKSWFFGTLSADVNVAQGETSADAEKRAGRGPAGQAYAYTNAVGGVFHNAMAISQTADLQMAGGLGNLGAQAGLMSGNPYLAAGGAAANVLFGQLAQSGNYLYGKGTELAQLERYREMSRGQGVDLGFDSKRITDPVNEMGYRPGEATWMAHGFYRGIGHGDASKYDSTQAMRYYQRLGVGMGQQAHFLSLDRAQTGDAQANLNTTLGTGATMGLAGQGLDQYLSRIAAATEGMRDRGLQMDEKSLVSFTKALHVSGGGVVADPQRAAIMATGLGSSTANLAQSMVGGFGGIVDASLMSAAAKEGGNYFDVVGKLQKWAGDPTEVYKRLVGQGLSEDTVAAGFMGKGWSVEEARKGAKGGLIGGLFDAMGFTSDTDPTWKKIQEGLKTSKEFAKADLEVNQAVSNNTGAIKELTAVLKKQHLYNIGLGNAAGKVEGAWQDINPLMADDKISGAGRALLLGMSPHITALRVAWSLWSK